MKKREPKEHTYSAWRKRYKCHKNKGNHTYKLVYGHWWRFSGLYDWVAAEYECTACGKKKVLVVK